MYGTILCYYFRFTILKVNVKIHEDSKGGIYLYCHCTCLKPNWRILCQMSRWGLVLTIGKIDIFVQSWILILVGMLPSCHRTKGSIEFTQRKGSKLNLALSRWCKTCDKSLRQIILLFAPYIYIYTYKTE